MVNNNEQSRNSNRYDGNNRNDVNCSYNGGNDENKKTEAEVEFESLGFNTKWITEGTTTEMVEFADKAGKFMANNNLTSSKIRSIYGEVKRIQMKGFEEGRTEFYLLKPKVAYTVGREKLSNKNHIQGLLLFKLIFDACFEHVTDEATYKNFCNLMEAILAYHKAYVKKDN